MLVKAPAFTTPLLSTEELAVFGPRVQMSAAMLDVHPGTHSFLTRRSCPLRNWRKRIDVQKLDIASASNCILGQLAGWVTGCMHLDASGVPVLASFGFITCGYQYQENCGRSCDLAHKEFAALNSSRFRSPVNLLTATWQYELTRAT
jgi:hypothetical protein